MATEIATGTSLPVTIPDTTDSADIRIALRQVLYGTTTSDPANDAAITQNSIMGHLYDRAPLSGATFTGDIAVNGGDITSTASTFNIGHPSSTTTAVTLNIEPATPATSVTKTINIGTNGSLGSTNIINLGPASTVLTSRINMNGKPVLFSQPLAGTIAAGMIEYDGTVFYATPKVNNTTAGRGLLPAQNLFMLYGNNTAPTVTSTSGSVNSEFYAFGKSLYLDSSTKYFVEMSIKVFHTITVSVSGNGSVVFFLKGQANTGHEINAQSQIDMASYATATTPTFEFLSGLGAGTKTIKSASGADTGYSIFNWSGIVSPGTSGSFAPGLSLTAVATGGTTTTSVTVASGSWCKITPIPNYAAADINIGGWA
jgi:hypothetical protein